MINKNKIVCSSICIKGVLQWPKSLFGNKLMQFAEKNESGSTLKLLGNCSIWVLAMTTADLLVFVVLQTNNWWRPFWFAKSKAVNFRESLQNTLPLLFWHVLESTAHIFSFYRTRNVQYM